MPTPITHLCFALLLLFRFRQTFYGNVSCIELEVVKNSASLSDSNNPTVSRAGFDTRTSSSSSSSSLSSFFGTEQRHVTSVTSRRPASVATAVSNTARCAQPPPPAYDKNMNIHHPTGADCKRPTYSIIIIIIIIIILFAQIVSIQITGDSTMYTVCEQDIPGSYKH